MGTMLCHQKASQGDIFANLRMTLLTYQLPSLTYQLPLLTYPLHETKASTVEPNRITLLVEDDKEMLYVYYDVYYVVL
jgi:hypothetical protein